jgi:hypothetical protein
LVDVAYNPSRYTVAGWAVTAWADSFTGLNAVTIKTINIAFVNRIMSLKFRSIY